MSFGTEEHNVYAAPKAGSEAGGRSFAIPDELRELIAMTATLMIIAGFVQLSSGVITLIREGFTPVGWISAALFGVVPAFTVIAGFSLRAIAKPGDDLGSLLAGFRSLHVAFLVKGIGLLLILGFMLLVLASLVFGLGRGFASLWM